jgi:hypothetical protein
MCTSRPPPDHRFRQPGDAADRPPPARAERLLRNPPVPERHRRDFLAEFAPKAVIFSGGPDSVIDEGSPRPPEERVTSIGVPILGICYGQQVMMQMLGGEGRKISGERHRGVRARLRDACRDPDRPPERLVPRRARTGLDEPRRPRRRIAPGFEVYGTSPGAPLRSPPTFPPTSTPCSSTPRCTTPRTARRFTRIS